MGAVPHLGALIDRCVEDYGDFDRLVCEGRVWRSVETQALGQRLAQGLIDLGLVPGDRVVTLLPNCGELLIVYAAIWRAGLVLVPLHPTTTPGEIVNRLRSSGATVVVHAEHLAQPVAQAGRDLGIPLTVIPVPTKRPASVAADPQPLAGCVHYTQLVASPPFTGLRAPVDDRAAIMFTGGTTGRPKGVVLTHANLWAAIHSVPNQERRYTGIWVLPMSHIGGILYPQMQQRFGFRTLLVTDPSPRPILEHIRDHRADCMHAVPTIFMAMLAYPEADQYDVSSVASWIYGGASFPEEKTRAFERRFGGTMHAIYGLTETCAQTTTTELQRTRKPGSVGRPARPSNFEVAIFDAHGAPVPTGELGEVCMRGASVTSGYLDLPEETARLFRDGWLRTGDIGRLDADGDLVLAGRSKDLIIRGGANVYPEEVESVIAGHPDVPVAAVVGLPNELFGEEVVAFVTRAAGAGAHLVDELTARCREHLAAYKVPRFEVIDALPRTPVGKIDKQALRGLGEELQRERRAQAGRAFRDALAARPPRERHVFVVELARMLARRVLRLEVSQPIVETEPLQQLGLDSVMATELGHLLGEQTGMRVAATLLYNYPTLAGLAGHVLAQVDGERHAEASAPVAAAAAEPIAIVSLACRFPGIESPEALWQLFAEGGDAVRPIPTSRWNVEELYDPDPAATGKLYAREGAMFDDIDQFDPALFGIAPREATSMDPQQRLLLETSWQLFERANLVPDHLRETSTGVYVGLYDSGYREAAQPGLDGLDGYVGTGNLASVASGRISYVFGLQGPAMTIDTACSSSLVALHLASAALRAGECDLAVAGGVSLMVTPSTFVEFSRLGGLSATGRCRSFSADADGTGWGEGCALLLLKRLSDAERDGDRVWAVIRSSAVNQDGRSQGLTAPNGPAQSRVIRRALAVAGLTADDIDYVDAHGTGTRLGDPIEAEALREVFRGRARPLLLGSAKSNLAHTQAAAGAASVLKVVLALTHDRLPATLHAARPTPHVPWNDHVLELATAGRPWLRGPTPRRAGVSSFGISGTNAHVVIEEAPAVPPLLAPSAWPDVVPVVLSGQTTAAVAAQAAALAAVTADRVDLARTLATSRTHFEQRVAFTAASGAELATKLASIAAGDKVPGSSVTPARWPGAGKLAWLFTGQGAQRPRMGHELYVSHPVYRAAVDRCLAAFEPHTGASLRASLFAAPGTPDAARLDRTGTTQPALFVVEWALAQLWASFGVEPDFVMGHSIGELVAATVAGVWSLDDACKLVAARGRLMDALPAGGAMAAIDLPGDVVRALLEGAVAIAAINGPAQVVVSGTEAAVAAVVQRAAAQGARAKRLVVSHAFHSPLMEPMLDELRAVARSLTYAPPALPLVSNLVGDIGGDVTEPEYWVRHVREAVRFRDGIGALEARGVTSFVELGPQAVLTAMGQACVADRDRRAFVPSLRASAPELRSVLEALGAVHVHGHVVDWTRAFAAIGGHSCALPTYPFQRQRYWLGAGRASAATSVGVTTHPLIGGVYRTASTGTTVVLATLSRKSPAWARDHRVFDRVLVSGTTLLELCRAALELLPEPMALEALAISAPLELPETGAIRVQVEIVDAQVTVYGRPAHDETAPWTQHATAQAVPPTAVTSPGLGPAWPAGDELVGDGFYAGLARRGLDYGPAFRGLRRARALGDGAVLAEVALPPELHAEAADHGLHPALLDAALHTLMTFAGESDETRVALPIAFGHLVVWKRGLASATVRMDRVATAEGVRVDLTLWDADGVPAARVTEIVARRADAASLRRAADRKPRELYEIAWHSVETASADAPGAWVVVGEPDDALVAAIAGELARRGATVSSATPGSAWPIGARVVRLWSAASDAGDVPAATLAATTVALGELQQLATAAGAGADVVWVTREAIAARLAEPVRGLVHAALWGLQRSARSEHPALGLRLVDAPRAGGELGRLVDAIVQRDEAEVAVRDGELRVPRLVANAPASERLDPPDAPVYRLESAHKGRLDRLELVAMPRRPLAAREVRVDVRASGLNFRDVLNALGMYPGEAGPLGSELAGIVTEVGAAVDELAVGARVMGFGAGTFGSEAVCDARALVTIPTALGFADAATVPLVFATAYYALRDLAHVKAGERLLVHAATGGVGMAALQLARLWGLEVFATASPAKWPVLHTLGIAPDHIASSRDVSFEAAFRAASPAGVDVVLDSLAGELVDASLRLLAPGGRFLEMGKTDIRDVRAADSLPPGATYTAFDLADPGPDRLREILRDLVELLERGAITPLPHRAFGLAHAPAVFRSMAQARHVGKLVLEPPRRPSVPTRGTILVTGGAGALGLAAARWLASRGVQHLVLASRNPAAADAVRELEALGTRVTVAACDVAVLADVRAMIAAIPADVPLRGIVHCAGILDDGVLVEQSAERLRTVMASKVHGGWNLHEATRTLPLELFVVYSSVAAIAGSPGQSNYAAANAFLDALAHDRRAAGLPAHSLAWGAWAGGGLATRSADLGRLAKQGFDAITPARGVELLEAALERDVVHQVPWAIDLARVAKSFANGKVPGLWRALVRPAAPTVIASSRLADLLAPLPAAERRERVLSTVREEAAQVLGMTSGADIPLKQPLAELGVDSLMAVELRNRLTERFDARLPSTLLFDHPSVEGVASYLLEEVLPPVVASAAAPAAATSASGHPLVRGRTAVPPSSVLVTASVGGDGSAYLHDHRIHGTAIFPATAYLELALAAGRLLHGGATSTLEAVTFERDLALGAAALELSIVVGAAQHGAAPFDIYSPGGDAGWIRHAHGRIALQPLLAPPVSSERADGGELRTGDDVYPALATRGLEYGPRFRTLTQLVRRGGGIAVGRAELHAELRAEASAYLAHPALVDAALHALAAAADGDAGVAIPVKIARFTVHSPGASAAWVQVGAAGVTLFDDHGEPLVELAGVEVRSAERRAP